MMEGVSKAPPSAASTMSRAQTKTTTAQQQQAAAAAAAKVSRSSEFGMKSTPAQPQSVQSLQAPPQQISTAAAPLNQTKALGRKSIQPPPTAAAPYDDEGQQTDYTLAESDDVELQAIIDYVDEYYYGVRIFPGQDASKANI